MTLAIRPARASDRAAVMDIVRTIWGGDDYLKDTFDEWIRQRRDRMYVAELEGRVVGVARLSWLGPRDAWLEALRVHPRSRGRGVGRALMEHRIALARAAGARRIAFSTAVGNVPQERSAARLGFRERARFATMRATARRGPLPPRARASDAAALSAIVRRERPLAVHGAGWRWSPLTVAELERAARAHRCYVSRDRRAFAIAQPVAERRGLVVRAYAGAPASIEELLSGLRAVARAAGLLRVVAYRPDGALEREFRRAGYRLAWRTRALYYVRELR